MAKKIFIFIIFSLFISSNSFSETESIKDLQKGGKIVLIRHALAPGGGDPCRNTRRWHRRHTPGPGRM